MIWSHPAPHHPGLAPSMLYALANYYGFHFQIPGEPDGFIMPGTSIIWELHVPDNSDGEAFVMAFYNYPTSTSGRVLLNMTNCPARCPLSKFLDIHNRRVSKLGGFLKLCPQLSGIKHNTHKTCVSFVFTICVYPLGGPSPTKNDNQKGTGEVS